MKSGVITLLTLHPFRNAYLLRGALVWIGLRFMLAFLSAMGARAGSLEPAPLTQVGIIGAVALVVYLDARRRSEDLLLGNLGIGGGAIALVSALGATVLEVLVP